MYFGKLYFSFLDTPYQNLKALTEVERLEKISLNKNPTEWEQGNKRELKITSINFKSLINHHEDISSDINLPTRR